MWVISNLLTGTDFDRKDTRDIKELLVGGLAYRDDGDLSDTLLVAGLSVYNYWVVRGMSPIKQLSCKDYLLTAYDTLGVGR